MKLVYSGQNSYYNEFDEYNYTDNETITIEAIVISMLNDEPLNSINSLYSELDNSLKN